MPSEYNQYVKDNYQKVKKALESQGHDASLGSVSKAISAMWRQTHTVVQKKKSPKKAGPRKCTQKAQAKCAAKGKVCHENEKRRSCRKAVSLSFF